MTPNAEHNRRECNERRVDAFVITHGIGDNYMILHRNYSKTTYADGRVKIFDPLIRWRYQDGIGEIGIRGDWSIGFMYGWRVGEWSRLKTRFVEFGKLTLYVHMGPCKAHNPRNGEIFE